MKKILLLSLLAGAVTSLSAQQLALINSGASLVVDNGTDVRLDEGHLRNNAGTVLNNGNIYVGRDYSGTGAYTGGGASWLWFDGVLGAQNLAGLSSLSRLRVDNGNVLTLGNDVTVTQNMDLNNNGDVELTTQNLTIAPSAVMTGYDENNFVYTFGAGTLKRTVGNSNVDFPVGFSSYNLATLNNSGTLDVFSARVVDEILEEGTSGPAETSDIVDRTWFIDENVNGGSDVAMTLWWRTAEEMPGFNSAACYIIHYDQPTTQWYYLGTPQAATPNGTGKTVTASGITDFSPFGVDDITRNLPIELLTFTAKRQNTEQAILNWSTATETNNKGFFVERLNDATNQFETVGFVDGAGTTTAQQMYSFLDPNTSTQVSYYRLRQIDFDGIISYTPVRAVEGIKAGIFVDNMGLYPVPARNYINIRFTDIPSAVEQATVRLFSVSGQLLVNKVVTAETLIRLNEVADLPAGLYLINVELDNGTKYVKEFVKNID